MNTITRRDVIRFIPGLAAASFFPTSNKVQAQTNNSVRSLIWISPDGGESSIDTWDPQPNAPSNIRSAFKPIQTAIEGIQVTEVYPKMAALLDRTVLLRGRDVGGSLDHLAAMKSLVGREGAMHMPKEYATRKGITPFYLEGLDVFKVDNVRDEVFGAESLMMELYWSYKENRFRTQNYQVSPHIQERMALLQKLDTSPIPIEREFTSLREEALQLIDTLQKQKEYTEDTERFGGSNPIAMGMLAIRNMIQSGLQGVYFFRAGDFDHHDEIFRNLRHRAGQMDNALAPMIEDVSSGSIPNTLLVYAGEFGRTARINYKGGRDHSHYCSALLCGGSTNNGIVYGSTNNMGQANSGIINARELLKIMEAGLAEKVPENIKATYPDIFR